MKKDFIIKNNMINALVKFKNKINNVAHLNIASEVKLFFPYKPALILSIIMTNNTPDLLFNNDIEINYEIAKIF